MKKENTNTKEKKFLLSLLTVIFIFLILFNPNKEDFNREIHDITYNGEYTYEEAKFFGADRLYESGYRRYNYFLFSIYKTNGSTNELWVKDGYKDKDVIFIGIFDFFIKIN